MYNGHAPLENDASYSAAQHCCNHGLVVVQLLGAKKFVRQSAHGRLLSRWRKQRQTLSALRLKAAQQSGLGRSFAEIITAAHQ